jgi:Tfp pilus assembly protein PilF
MLSKMLPRFPPPSRRNTLAVALILLWPAWVLSQDQSGLRLRGKVCDSTRQPIASATVILQAQDQTKLLRAQTSTDGTFTFPSLPAGTYRLQVSAAGFVGVSIPVGPISSQNETFETIVLKAKNPNAAPPSSAAPQFFDPPQFTVSGVTDTTNLGGHGSGPVMRNREAVAKDVTSLGGHSPARTSANVSSGYDLALSDANAGDYSRARAQLEGVIADQPTAEAHHLLAAVDEKLGDSLDAVQEYERAAELDRSEPNMFDWGSELLLHHAPEPAVEVFTKGSRLFPDSSRMLIGLAAAEFSAGSAERAVRLLCQDSDSHPEDPLPYQFLGKIQRSENTISADSVERYRRFVKLSPDNASANYLYAVALWKRSPPTSSEATVAEIESLLDTAIRLDAKYAEAYLQRAILYASVQNSAAAIADFQRAIENQPNLEEAHYRLAQAYRAAGKMDEARSEVEAYQRLRQQSKQASEREHHEIKQFVYRLRDKPASQVR